MVSVKGKQSVFIHHQYHSLLIIKMGVAPRSKMAGGCGERGYHGRQASLPQDDLFGLWVAVEGSNLTALAEGGPEG